MLTCSPLPVYVEDHRRKPECVTRGHLLETETNITQFLNNLSLFNSNFNYIYLAKKKKIIKNSRQALPADWYEPRLAVAL